MAAPIPSSEPKTVSAGNTIQWTKSVSDYPADQGWVLSYAFVSTVGNKFGVTATASGSEFLVTIAASTSAGYVAGTWTWQAYVSKAAERFLVDSGSMKILPDYSAQATTLDTRSHARRCLELIMLAMEGRLPDGLDGYSIGGVDIRMIGLAQLRELYDKYLSDVMSEDAADRIANGLGSGRNIYVRFSRP